MYQVYYRNKNYNARTPYLLAVVLCICLSGIQFSCSKSDTGTQYPTVSVEAPLAPVLISPANAATGAVTSPTLTWGTVSGATSYRVQLSIGSAFTTTVVDDSNLTAGTKAITGLANSTTYYWRANAKNTGGTSSWSALFSFTTSDNKQNQSVSKSLARLDIANAKSLYIVSNNSLSKRSSTRAIDSTSKLFKITQDGYAVQVSCFDSSGNTITNLISPISLCNLSDNFLTVTFQNEGTFLIRKSDGAAFKGSNLPSSFPDPSIYDRSDLFKQQDGQGNIYYIYNQKVIKLTVTDPNNLTVSTYSAPGDQVSMFIIDNSGNMAYNPNAGSVSRYRHASGSFENITASDAMYTDVNNDLMFGRNEVGSGLNITRIVPTSPLTFSNYGDTAFYVGCISHLAKIKNKNTVIGEGCDFVYDLYNTDGIVSKLPYSYFKVTKITMLASSDNYYYIIGTNSSNQKVLIKVDPNGNTYTNLLTTGDYDIYNVVINSADEVEFYALRMSDGKRVLAGLNNAGGITIISVFDESSVTALERIN